MHPATYTTLPVWTTRSKLPARSSVMSTSTPAPPVLVPRVPCQPPESCRRPTSAYCIPHRSRLTGRRALVFGSTSGLGRACAEVLAAEGARVAVSGRDEAKARDRRRWDGRGCDRLWRPARRGRQDGRGRSIPARRARHPGDEHGRRRSRWPHPRQRSRSRIRLTRRC